MQTARAQEHVAHQKSVRERLWRKSVVQVTQAADISSCYCDLQCHRAAFCDLPCIEGCCCPGPQEHAAYRTQGMLTHTLLG